MPPPSPAPSQRRGRRIYEGRADITRGWLTSTLSCASQRKRDACERKLSDRTPAATNEPGARAARRLRPVRGRTRLADFGLFAALQPVAASLHGRDELRQVHLEGVQDVVG